MRVGVTGASGFIGAALCKAFVNAGWRVVGFARRADRVPPGVEWRPFELHEGLPPEMLSDIDVLVHTAYDMSPHLGDANVRASRALFAAAARAGTSVRVLISSMSAAAGAATRYGRVKAESELLLDPTRDLIVRPGLVIGDGGLFAAMCRSVRRYRLVPVFDGGRQPVYVTAIDDFCHAMVKLIAERATGTHAIADPRPMQLRELYQTIAKRAGVRAVLVPLPLEPVLRLIRVLEKTGIKLPVDSERLVSIRNLRAMDIS